MAVLVDEVTPRSSYSFVSSMTKHRLPDQVITSLYALINTMIEKIRYTVESPCKTKLVSVMIAGL
jgi:hypothetical protein